jgi:hypothetical protein
MEWEGVEWEGQMDCFCFAIKKGANKAGGCKNNNKKNIRIRYREVFIILSN